MKFSEAAKTPLGNYFGEGVHKVEILEITAGKADNGNEYFEFKVGGENGEEGTARMYWTEKAEQYSFNAIRDIFVHNTVEKNKDEVRDAVNAVSDTAELLKLCQDSLIGKECWYVVQKTDRTYVNSEGETKNSYNRNLYGYEFKMKQPTADELVDGLRKNGATDVDTNEIPFE